MNLFLYLKKKVVTYKQTSIKIDLKLFFNRLKIE